MKLTWLGHATVLIETGGRRLLTDPVLGRRAGLLRRLVPPPLDGTSARIDAVLLSHLHADHADLPSLRRVGATVPIIAPPGAAHWLVRHGFGRVRELSADASTNIDGVVVGATRASHEHGRWSRRGTSGVVGFLVEGDRCVYFAGDTDVFPEMASLGGRVDIALLPVAGWGPNLGPGHLDPLRAAEVAATIRPAVAIPIHWGTLGLPWQRASREILARPARAFAANALRLAPGVEVRVLDPGDATALE